ncbi:MAG: ATP-binding cassette, subfamily bacterial [Gaiellaceae bacterium]|nr:ATP-binding cassette, subfamily bacterial [Gaiellaceae bacterium]
MAREPSESIFTNRPAERIQILRSLPVVGWPTLVGAVLLQLVAGLLPVGFIVSTSVLIGRIPAAAAAGTGSHAAYLAEEALFAAAAFFVLQQILAPLQMLLTVRVTRRFDGAARDRLLRASFASAGIAELEDPERHEALVMARDSLAGFWFSPGEASAGTIALVSRYTTCIAMAIVVGAVYSWPVALMVLAGGLTLRFVWRHGLTIEVERLGPLWRHVDRSWYFRNLALGTVAAKEIRVFGLTAWMKERYHQASLDHLKPYSERRWKVWVLPFLPATLLAAATASAALALVAHAAGAHPDQVSLQDLALVIQAAIATLAVASWYHEADMQTQFGLRGHRGLNKLDSWRLGDETDAGGTGRDPAGLPLREIRFESVTFTYPGAPEPVLSRFDLTIEAGASLAIVGLNGAGKTTIVKLLARLYEPQEGRITCDGIDIRDFPAAAWQRRIGAIFQDFLRYELTLRENVGYGAVELADDTDVVNRALERGGAAELRDSLDHGLETMLSREYEDGTDLSGGQWQRVAIARALMAVEGGASVLVLDEPTANLDVRAEVEFFGQFLELTRGLTTIVISHRFSTVRRADRVVVLQQGRIIEDGTHAELVALGGLYAELFELQAARFVDEQPELA